MASLIKGSKLEEPAIANIMSFSDDIDLYNFALTNTKIFDVYVQIKPRLAIDRNPTLNWLNSSHYFERYSIPHLYQYLQYAKKIYQILGAFICPGDGFENVIISTKNLVEEMQKTPLPPLNRKKYCSLNSLLAAVPDDTSGLFIGVILRNDDILFNSKIRTIDPKEFSLFAPIFLAGGMVKHFEKILPLSLLPLPSDEPLDMENRALSFVTALEMGQLDICDTLKELDPTFIKDVLLSLSNLNEIKYLEKTFNYLAMDNMNLEEGFIYSLILRAATGNAQDVVNFLFKKYRDLPIPLEIFELIMGQMDSDHMEMVAALNAEIANRYGYEAQFDPTEFIDEEDFIN